MYWQIEMEAEGISADEFYSMQEMPAAPLEMPVIPLTEQERVEIRQQVVTEQPEATALLSQNPGDVLGCLALQQAYIKARALFYATQFKLALNDYHQNRVSGRITTLNNAIQGVKLAIARAQNLAQKVSLQKELFKYMDELADLQAELADLKKYREELELENTERLAIALQLEMMLWMNCWNVIPIPNDHIPFPIPDPISTQPAPPIPPVPPAPLPMNYPMAP
jgi:hypothetical protein